MRRRRRRKTGCELLADSASENDRPTLLTCEACEGAGKQETRLHGPGTYMVAPCQWCDGVGGFTRSRRAAWRRWQGIRDHHVRRGLCRAL